MTKLAPHARLGVHWVSVSVVIFGLTLAAVLESEVARKLDEQYPIVPESFQPANKQKLYRGYAQDASDAVPAKIRKLKKGVVVLKGAPIVDFEDDDLDGEEDDAD